MHILCGYIHTDIYIESFDPKAKAPVACVDVYSSRVLLSVNGKLRYYIQPHTTQTVAYQGILFKNI